MRKHPGDDAAKPTCPLFQHVALIISPILLLKTPPSGLSFGSPYSYSLPRNQLLFLWFPRAVSNSILQNMLGPLLSCPSPISYTTLPQFCTVCLTS